MAGDFHSWSSGHKRVGCRQCRFLDSSTSSNILLRQPLQPNYCEHPCCSRAAGRHRDSFSLAPRCGLATSLEKPDDWELVSVCIPPRILCTLWNDTEVISTLSEIPSSSMRSVIRRIERLLWRRVVALLLLVIAGLIAKPRYWRGLDRGALKNAGTGPCHFESLVALSPLI